MAPSGHLRVPWRLSVFAMAFAAAWVFANTLLYPALSFATSFLSPAPPLYSWVMLAATAAACLVAIEQVDGQSFGADLATNADAWAARTLARGGLWGVLAISVVLGVLMLSGGQRVEQLSDDSGWSAHLATAGRALWLLAPAALWEELMFRGYLWRVAVDAANARVALWSTSVAFGLVHVLNPGATVLSLAAVVLAGVCLGAMRHFTGSLPAAWMAHLAWNWVMAAVAHVPVSGLPFAAPGWRLEPAGPEWWSGGSWGPEGGLASFLVLLTALVATLWWRRRAAGGPATAFSSNSRAQTPVVAPSRS